METIYLNNRQIQSILSVAECIGVVETVFKNLDLSQMPPKIYLDIPDGDFRAMPAVFDKTAGIKWCGVHLDKQKQKRKINIFAKVLKGEIPCKKIYEDKFVLSFYDINPQKKVHALVIPKGKYIDLDDFASKASEKEISALIRGVNTVAKKLQICEMRRIINSRFFVVRLCDFSQKVTFLQ